MARGIEAFKELSAEQTRQFLDSLNNSAHIQRSKEDIERVKKMHFIVIE